MTQQQIKDMQQRIGVTPDGFWGPRSIAACKAHLLRMMPKPNPWPSTDQRSLQRFYGSPGDESRLTKLTTISVIGLGMQYEGKPVRFVRCNGKVAVSLLAIFKDLEASEWSYLLRQYEGCYNNRPMRGGSLPSLHARGAAIDFAAATNGNQTAWPTRATMPLDVMEIFAKHGWVAAGAFWGRDGMHFQATRL